MIDLSKVDILKAIDSDLDTLTEISFAAKTRCKYPDNMFIRQFDFFLFVLFLKER